MLPTRSMGARVRPDLAIRYPAPRERVAVHVARAAQRYGLRPATLHKMLHGDRPLDDMLAAVIEEAVRLGRRERVEPFFARLEAAYVAVRVRALTDGLVMQAVVADEDENVARDAFLLNRNPATRRQWKRAIELERSTKLEIWSVL